ncbi:MAG: DUF4174 domain-containing protein [Syntrophobacterales bacterium]
MCLLKILSLVCLSLALNSGAVWAGTTMDVADLDQYTWQNRLLFLFATSAEDPAFQSLSREVDQNLDGIRDRDLLVFRVLSEGLSLLGPQEISPEEAARLRRRFGISPGAFTVVLVGKDGGVKLKRSGQIALSDIFGLIDSMPMRRREMRTKDEVR